MRVRGGKHIIARHHHVGTGIGQEFAGFGIHTSVNLDYGLGAAILNLSLIHI